MLEKIVILVGKSISYISSRFSLGNGSTWPGHIALYLNPSIIKSLEKNLRLGSVVVAGTNGKTTTAKIIREVLETKFRVVHNQSGANLLNGIASSLIQSFTFDNKNNHDIGVFEVDENTLPLVINTFFPRIVIILNLFRDQLDRYGEVNNIARIWKESLKKLPSSTTVILNADDPQVAFLGKDLKAKVVYFGLNDKNLFLKSPEHATDSTYCPSCGEKLDYQGIFYSHLGIWECKSCGLKKPTTEKLLVKMPLPGTYNIYNTGACETALKMLDFNSSQIQKALTGFKPAFGRQEEIEIDGKAVKILLSKNPTGFNQSIRTLDNFSSEKKYIFLILNDRIPDGRDISWIWDVDYENLKNKVKKIYISGDRCYDMALRIKYSQVLEESCIEIFESTEKGLVKAIKALSAGEALYILPTYSAMLDVRKVLRGKKIL